MNGKVSRWVGIAAGAAVFGTLMAFRSSVEPAWARVLVAAAAGGVLGVLIVSARARPRS
jgi:hypothetical protein